MKHILSLCLIALAAFTLAGCRSATLQPVETNVYASDKATVERAIIEGCIERGWSPKKINDSEIEASIHVRSHSAVVRIPYTATGYQILYKSSENLNYDAADKTIHGNFVNWVRNLDRSISKRLILPAATPVGSAG